MSEKFIYYDNEFCHAISQSGFVRNNFGDIVDPYVSTIGIPYVPYTFDGGITRLKRLDIVLANTFIPVPSAYTDLMLTVKHVDGDVSNINIDNLLWTEDVEEWKTADFINGYHISSWGRIRSPHSGIINGTIRNGYPSIVIADQNTNHRTWYLVHRLVAELFVGSTTGMIVNHIDGDKCNCRYDNLEIVTYQANNSHAIQSGLCSRKIDSEMGKLIDRTLIDCDGSPRCVINQLNSMGIHNITETIVGLRKRKLIESGHTFKVKHTQKLNNQCMIDKIKELLISYNGDTRTVYESIVDEYPDISRDNIYTIRTKMRKKGHAFVNYKLNRKISEESRAQLIELLKINDMSQSKTFRNISNIERFNDVT